MNLFRFYAQRNIHKSGGAEMFNLPPNCTQTFLREIHPELERDYDRNSDDDLQELTDALSQEEIDELNAELAGKYDPPPTPRWPKER